MSSPASANPPWCVPIEVAEISETGRRFAIVADAHTRDAVAKLAAVPALPRLTAEFELTRYGHDGVRVVGSVSATVEQNCVATLEPMQTEVEEEIDLLFEPPQTGPPGATHPSERERQDEESEVLRDGVVDLGAVATEFLILGIDPYPRKEGAVFNAPIPKEDLADRPFAALAALKKDKPRQDR